MEKFHFVLENEVNEKMYYMNWQNHNDEMKQRYYKCEHTHGKKEKKYTVINVTCKKILKACFLEPRD